MLAVILTTATLDWSMKHVELSKLKSYGLPDISSKLKAKTEWKANIGATMTWIPADSSSAGRRAVMYTGRDRDDRVVYCIVACPLLKGDEPGVNAVFGAHRFFVKPTNNRRQGTDYRNFVCINDPYPYWGPKDGDWGIYMEVRMDTPWASDQFRDTVFAAFGRKYK